MAHAEQIRFCKIAKALFPDYFHGIRVADIGSADINGNNKFLFTGCNYTGYDIWNGPNVDIICEGKNVPGLYGTVITTNCLEHDRDWMFTLMNCVRITHPLGMLLITVPTTGYPEHGTSRVEGFASPATNDYYRNLTEQDIKPIVEYQMPWNMFMVNEKSHDLYFIGFKITPRPKLRFALLRYIWIETKYFFWMRVKDYKNAFKRLNGEMYEHRN